MSDPPDIEAAIRGDEAAVLIEAGGVPYYYGELTPAEVSALWVTMWRRMEASG